MMRAASRKKRKTQVIATLEVLDDSGLEFLAKKSFTASGINIHSHLGSVLASVILQIEHGDPEAFCRIMVATFGSGWKFLADILGKDANKKVLLRFADLLDKAEILNDGPDVEDSDSDDEGDDDNEWQ